MAVLSEDFLTEDDFEDVLAFFCCYDYSANASVAGEKITTEHKDYHNSSLVVIVCCIAIEFHQKQKKGWLLGHFQRS